MKFVIILSRFVFLFFLFFSCFNLFPRDAKSADVQFSWTPNTEVNLKGYKIHYGLASGDYTNEVNVGNPTAVDSQIVAGITGLDAGVTYYFAATAYDIDGFESDYSTEAQWTSPSEDLITTVETDILNSSDTSSDPADAIVGDETSLSDFVFEMGEVSVNADWAFVEFSQGFVDPVVIAKPASNFDPNPCVVRIRNVSSTGFEMRLQNWNYLADNHGYETVGFIALEKGKHVLDDGSLVEAGSFETNNIGIFVSVPFSSSLNKVPVVAASIVTSKGADPVVGRMRNISKTGFDYTMQEQEGNVQAHAYESVSYIAWEPSPGIIEDLAYEVKASNNEIGSIFQTISFANVFETAPVFLADMQTTAGLDTANMRYTNLTTAQVQLRVAEEQSLDSETGHALEVAGFMAFSVIDQYGDLDQDSLTTADERDVFGTNPAMKDTDKDGLDDDIELDYWGANWNSDYDQDGLINIVDPDSDNDGYPDGIEVSRFYDPSSSGSHPDGPPVEAGIISVSSDWQRISFQEDFINPVVIAKIVSQNALDPCVVRLRNVDGAGFDIRLQEWNYLDGAHAVESVSYIVMERGRFTLSNGAILEAGHFETNQTNNFVNVPFSASFNVVPVVASSVESFNGGNTVTGRMRNIGKTGFEFTMQEQEANVQKHFYETISYIAWEPSSGSLDGLVYEVGVASQYVQNEYVPVDLLESFSGTPTIVADMQTAFNPDTALVRCDNVSSGGFEVRVEEEQSADPETLSVADKISYIAVGLN